jgi:hypothetical protein
VQPYVPKLYAQQFNVFLNKALRGQFCATLFIIVSVVGNPKRQHDWRNIYVVGIETSWVQTAIPTQSLNLRHIECKEMLEEFPIY